MKVATLSLVVLPAVQALVAQPKAPESNYNLPEKRQMLATLTTLLGRGGKVADPPGAAPRRQILQTTMTKPGVQRVKLRYGPYSVPGMNKTSIKGEAGALWNYPDMDIAKPCEQCVILGQQAGLEYPDGRNANIDTGMWLHHMVHFLSGPGRWDPTCSGRLSLPHTAVEETPGRSERYFSSGNERTLVSVQGSPAKVGVQIRPADSYQFVIDLMNMNPQDRTVYVTMTYDILPGVMPPGWKNLKTVWLDARQCGTSEVVAPQQTGSFTIASRPWKPNFEGDVLGMGGHLHDGGVAAQIDYAPGKVACVSKASYNTRPDFENTKLTFGTGPSAAHGHGIAPQHISDMTLCISGVKGEVLPVKKLSPDQAWTVNGEYDYNKFPGNTEMGGKQDEIMAIALVYVAVDGL